MVTSESLQETTIAHFESLTPFDLPFSQNGVSNAGPSSRRPLPPGEYDRRYQHAGCQYKARDVAFYQLTLALVHCTRRNQTFRL